jgi:Serine/threonine protein kinase
MISERHIPMPATHTILQQRYQLETLLGQGGFGAVYRAHDQRLQQTVAIKETIDHTPDRVRQFEYEAHLLAGLRHPALPAVIDHFVENGNHYLVMQYIPGETLSAYLERQPRRRLNEGEALRIVTPLLAALDYMHQRTPPIIHRDIKPDNIRLHPEGSIYLVDFGLAKIYNPALPTTTGARAVTAGFSPLEQYGVGSTDARSDLYALGATLYTMLSGEAVLEAPQRALNDTLLPLRHVNPSISPRMEALVMRLLA